MDDKTTALQILERIKSLEEMLRMVILEKKLEDLEKRIAALGNGIDPDLAAKGLDMASRNEKLKQRKSDPLPEALDNLEDITTVKKDKDGKRTYLLHRPTQNFEYEKFADENTYETSNDTDWIAEIEAAESQQQHKNPVVSVWTPEDAIVNMEGSEGNTGTWGELGANPNATKFRIWLKPGRYEIYRELRQ